MWYAFLNLDTGSVAERFYSNPDNAPEVGAVIEDEDGSLKRLDRAPDAPEVGPVISVKGQRWLRNGNYTPMQIPKHHPDAPRVDAQGRAVFTSQEEVDAFKRKTGAVEGGATVEAGTEPKPQRAARRKKYGLDKATARFQKEGT